MIYMFPLHVQHVIDARLQVYLQHMKQSAKEIETISLFPNER